MDNLSIHPRNWPDFGTKEKKNTCAPSSLGKRLTHQISGLERHIESNPRDAAAQSRLANAQSRLKDLK